MSGVGKSQLARKYCLKFKECYDKFLWIDASFGKIQTSIVNLFNQLELNTKNDNECDINIITKKVHNYFKEDKTLYIFDSVDDESIKDFEKYISNEKRAFTIVTSQWTNWSDNFHQLRINVFNHEEALMFMKNRIKKNEDEKILEIIKEVRYHPLALNQAIVYIVKNRVSLEEYLKLFRSNPVEVLENGLQTEAEKKSAIMSINLLLCKLKVSYDIPFKIINVLSHCDGNKVAKEFIFGISKVLGINKELTINSAILVLTSYSLLDWSDCDSDYLIMHDITQVSCKHYQKGLNITDEIKEHIITYFKQKLKETKEHIDYGKEFVSHFLHMFRSNKQCMSEMFHQYSEHILTFLTTKCLFQEVITILTDIKKYNLQTFGECNLLSLKTMFNIAFCFLNLGKYNEALEIYYRVKEVSNKISTVNDIFVLQINHNIAVCLVQMGKYHESYEICLNIEKMLNEISVINCPFMLAVKNNIASCLDNMGKRNEALKIYYQIEKIQVKLLGTNHSSLLITKCHIALILNKIGKHSKALEIYHGVQKIQTEILGIDHLSTLTTKHYISICLNDMGKYNEALEIAYQVEKMQVECNFGRKSSIIIGNKTKYCGMFEKHRKL